MPHLLIGILVDDYQPSNGLLESFAMLEKSRVTPGTVDNSMLFTMLDFLFIGQQEVGVKNEPEVRDLESDYQPSDAFLETLTTQLNYGTHSPVLCTRLLTLFR